MEHVREDQQLLNEIHPVTVPRGYALVSVPSNYSWLWSFGKHGYHFYSVSELTRKIANSGFKIEVLISIGGGFSFSFYCLAAWILALCNIANFKHDYRAGRTLINLRWTGMLNSGLSRVYLRLVLPMILMVDRFTPTVLPGVHVALLRSED